jgi:hypothetical protein
MPHSSGWAHEDPYEHRHAEVGLVEQRRGAEGDGGAGPMEMAFGETVELVVEESEKLFGVVGCAGTAGLKLACPAPRRPARGRPSGPSSAAAERSPSVRRSLLIALLAVIGSDLHAQSSAYPDLLTDLRRNRTTVLAYIDAMPDSATGFRPTLGVRSFAEQFDHIATTNLEVAAVALRGLKTPPTLGDSAMYLHDKVALRTYAAATYDYFIDAFTKATPAQLARPVAMYGQPPQPAVRLAALSFEHSVWTLGQLVPYLRINGVTPPEYSMPF